MTTTNVFFDQTLDAKHQLAQGYALLSANPEAAEKAATDIIALRLGVSPDRARHHAQVTWVGEDEGSIGRAAVTDVLREVSLTSGDSGQPRFVVILGSERLTTEAANALLKALEEPPSDVHWLLLARTAAGIMPTVRSRVQLLTIPQRSSKTEQSSEVEESVQRFLDTSLPKRLAIIADLHKNHTEGDFIPLLVRQLRETGQYAALQWLSPYDAYVAASGNRRLLLEAFAVHLEAQS